MPNPKKIIYLFGAGATHAEVEYIGVPGNLLMRDGDSGEGVSTGILRRMGERGRSFATDTGVDIEKLISLLGASGVAKQVELAEEMRRHYFDEICQRLGASAVIEKPLLAMGLLEMHKIPEFVGATEELSGILTTNHDGLLQIVTFPPKTPPKHS